MTQAEPLIDPPVPPSGPGVGDPAGESDHGAALLAGFLGWTLDAFDFFVLVLCLPAIAADLHVAKTQVAKAISLTLLMRPVGAVLFGLLADRYGRRRPLMVNLVFYSTLSVLSGFAPNFTAFLACRVLFGVAMGGEWGVGASLAMEKVPPRLRGLLSGLLQEGYAAGNLLASVAFFLVVPHLGPHVGWRALFWIGGLPALLALFVRSHVSESGVWERTRARDWSHLFDALAQHWRVFVSIAVLMLMMNLASHGTQDMFPTLLKDSFHLSQQMTAVVNGISSVGAICGGVVVGLLSDRLGRRRAMAGAFVLAIAVVPLWAYAHTLGALMAGAFLIQFMVQGAWGVIPAHITELSPDNVRGFLPGFAYQCGVAVAGGVTYLEASLQARYKLTDVMAGFAVVIFAVAAVVVGLGRERRGRAFGTDPADG